MARSCRSLALLLAGALAAQAAAVAQVSSTLPIKVDAASSEVDYKTNTLVFKDVTITQGTTRVQADRAHATGLEFANSKWSFDGNVRITAEPRGNLRSDTAVVEFRDNHIARATITGKPAQFEQKRPDTGQMAQGRANQIVYDMDAGTVVLSDDAWLSNAGKEISAPVLTYNVKEQNVKATTTPDTDQRIHITIGGTDASGAAAPKPDPGKGPAAPGTPP
jgi:lipopolysaccharide export system protein LptA